MLTTTYPKYVQRFCFHGSAEHLCPYCGNITKFRISRGQFKFQCHGDNKDDAKGRFSYCGRSWVFGMRLAPMPVGKPYSPPDTQRLLPQGLSEAFPAGEAFRWRSSTPVHVLTLPAGVAPAPGDAPLPGVEVERGTVYEFVRTVQARMTGGSMDPLAAMRAVMAEWGMDWRVV